MITILAFSSLVKICSRNQQLVFCPHSVETKKDLEEIIFKRLFFLYCVSKTGMGGVGRIAYFLEWWGRVKVDRVKNS